MPTLRRNPDVEFVGGFIGARGNFTEKLSGTAKVGYEWRRFTDGSSVPSEPVADLAITEQFSEKRGLSLTYSRQNNLSVQYSRQTYTADSVGLVFTQTLGPSRKWQATVSGNYTLYSVSAARGD